MKKTFLYLIVFIVVLGCKKEKELSFLERYEDEAYELLNHIYLPYLDRNKINESFGFSRRQLFENSLDINSDVRLLSLFSVIETKFQKEDLDLNNKLRIINWDRTKLVETRIINSLKRNKFNHLTKRLEDIDYPSKNYNSTKFNQTYKEYIQKWKEEMGGFYIQISSPIFNKDFTNAVLFYRLNDIDFVCGTGKTGFKEFEKVNNNWIMLKREYENY